MKTLDGILFARMVNSGAANLKAHAKEINDLNRLSVKSFREKTMSDLSLYS